MLSPSILRHSVFLFLNITNTRMFNSNPYKTIDIIILFSPFFNIKDVKNYFISQKSYDNVSFSMVRYSVILK